MIKHHSTVIDSQNILVNFYTNRGTGNDGYSGDRYSGNDGYSGLNPLDDAILFTVSGITAIADKTFGDFDKNDDFSKAITQYDFKKNFKNV